MRIGTCHGNLFDVDIRSSRHCAGFWPHFHLRSYGKELDTNTHVWLDAFAKK